MKTLIFLTLLGIASGQGLAVSGLANVGIRVSDLDKARDYYTRLLGYEVAFEQRDEAGEITALHFKVNDEQFIEIYPGMSALSDKRRTHIAFISDNAKASREKLIELGLAPGALEKNATGNLEFTLQGPEGTPLKFVQYLPGSLQARTKGKYLGSRRISTRLRHAGLIVQQLDPSLKFYSELLGFKEFWRGGMEPDVLRWITFRIAESDHGSGDYVEFMLEANPPNRKQRGAMEHIGLEVADINVARGELLARGMSDEKPRQPLLGIDRHWLLNVLDPDGTRTEFMEGRTVLPDAAN